MRYKSIILLALSAMLCLTSEAQVKKFIAKASNDPFVKSLTFYGRIGWGYNGMTGSPSPEFKSGYDVAIGAQHKLNTSGLYCNAEIGMSSRGFQESGERDYGAEHLNFKQKANAIRIGIGAGKIYTLKNPRLALDPHISVYASYDVGGSRDAWIVVDGYKQTVNGDIGTGRWYKDWNEWDIGGEIGCALWINSRYGIDARYRQGILDAITLDGKHAQTSNVIISCAMKF